MKRYMGVVKIMVPLWIPIIVRHLIFRALKKDFILFLRQVALFFRMAIVKGFFNGG